MTAVLAVGLCSVALAQSDIIPPKSYTVTPGGINVADGSLVYSVTDLSIGPLSLQRFYRTGQSQPNNPPFGKNFSSNFDIYVAITQPPPFGVRYPIVHLGSRASGVYSQSNASLSSIGPDNDDAKKGSLSWTGSQYVYVDNSDGSGTIYTFSATIQGVGGPWASLSRKIERIDFADGRRQVFSYDSNGYLKLVEDSSGYAMVFDYDANGDVTAACAFNRAQTYVTASSTCSGAQLKTTYSYTNLYLTSATDVLGQVTTYTNTSMGMTCIKPPGYSSCAVSMPNHTARIPSQTLQDGGTWYATGMNPDVLNNPDANYDYDGSNEVSVTDPNNVTIHLKFTKTSPYQMTDANNHVTHFRYEGAHRYYDTGSVHSDGTFLMEATYPEGNKYQAQYNGPFKSLSRETFVSKGGQSNLVKEYGYGSCSTPPGSDQNCAKPIWVRDPKGNQTDYTYALHGGMLSEMQPAPSAGAARPLKVYVYTQKYAYIKNSSGSLVPAASPLWVPVSETSCQTAPGSSSPVCDSGAMQTVTTYEYGPNSTANNLNVRGTVVSWNGASLRTCYGYDHRGNKLWETRPRAGLASCPLSTTPSTASDFTWAWRYDAMSRVTGTLSPDPDGGGPLHYAAVRNTYDVAGRLIKSEKGELSSWYSESTPPASWGGFAVFQTIDIAPDALGRKVSETVSSGGTAYHLTQYRYDGPGRLSCTAVRMNPAAFGAASDACTVGTQGSFGPDRITHQVYDDAGQLLKVQRAYGTSLQQDYATYIYSPNGKRTTVTDANGNTSLMTYDGFDRLQKLNFPSKTSPGAWSSTDYEQYDYDANSNRTYFRKRDEQVITYVFDDLNRVEFKDVPGSAGDVHYDYDVRGLQLYARFGSPSGPGITTTYDGFGRKLTSTNNTGGVSRTLDYQYDAHGNRTRLTFPDGQFFMFAYDGLDRMSSIWENGSTAVGGISYDTQGRRSTLTGGVATGYGYDAVGRLSSLSHNLAGTAQDVAFTYPTYNPASQILSKSRDNDAYAWTGAVTVNDTYAVNGLNQYTTVGTASPVHDDNGNLEFDGSTTYGYDAENRLISASGAGNATLTYDPAGRLFQVQVTGGSTTRFLYDGDELVAEYDGAGTLLRRYVHGSGVDEPLLWYEGSGLGNRQHLRTDHQGSVIAVTDAAGNVLGLNSYDEFGVGAGTNLGKFQYTGQIVVPELGLYYYKARMYSAKWGRFLQTDPIGYEDDVNLYAYVGNDPVNATDSTGQFCESRGTCDFARDERALLAGKITPEQFQENDAARGAGAVVGAAIVATGTAIVAAAGTGTVVTTDAAATAVSAARGAAAASRLAGAEAGATTGAVTASGEVFTGASTAAGGPGAATNASVQAALDSVPQAARSAFHGCCGEINALSNVANAGARVEGAMMATVRAAGRGADSLMRACPTCRAVAQKLGVRIVEP